MAYTLTVHHINHSRSLSWRSISHCCRTRTDLFTSRCLRCRSRSHGCRFKGTISRLPVCSMAIVDKAQTSKPSVQVAPLTSNRLKTYPETMIRHSLKVSRTKHLLGKGSKRCKWLSMTKRSRKMSNRPSVRFKSSHKASCHGLVVHRMTVKVPRKALWVENKA